MVVRPKGPTYRATCGSRWGISTHVENGEEPCGTCLEADDLARARHEARQSVPDHDPVQDALATVIAVLAQMLDAYDACGDIKRRRSIRQRRDAKRDATTGAA